MNIYKNILINLFYLIILIKLSICCPDQVRQFCSCVDQFDGILVNCTAPTFGKDNSKTENWADNLIKILKSNQAHLGLLKILSIHGNDQGNILPILSENIFQGLYIKRLELVNCGIKIIQKGAFKGLDSVLQEILINGNKIEEISFNAFNQLNSLVRLDLSDNNIEELKSEHSLPRIAKLNDLNLSHNRINSIHKTFFDNVKHSLQTINLGHNQLEEVPASSLRGFRMLMALHLHNNNLKNLPQLSFMNLPVLSLLNLAANQINSIHRQAFLNVPQLRFLYLSANQLNEVQPFQFSSFERLEMLDLTNNKIDNLQNDTFAGLSQLKQLYLGENKIEKINSEAFSSNSSIAVLILEQNKLKELQKDAFHNLKQLQQLSVKANKIISVDPSTFRGNPSLAMLDLSHNEIIDLTPGTFLSQLNLLLVDLSNNKILRTPYGAFGKRVATVLLKDNPLVCIERIHMLQQGNGIFIPNSDDAFCGENKDNNETSSASASPLNQLDPEVIEGSSIMPTLSEEDKEEEEDNDDNEPLTSPSPFIQQIEEVQQSLNKKQKINNLIKNNNYYANGTNKNIISSKQRIKPIRIISNSHHLSNNKPIVLTESLIGDSDYTTTYTETPSSSSNITESNHTDLISTSTIDNLNPRIIYPHPVPFLKPAPKMHTATHVKNDENGNPILLHTLPPSIVVAENSWHLNQHIPFDENLNENDLKDNEGLSETTSLFNNISAQNNYSTIENNEKIEEFPLLLSKSPLIIEENSLQNINLESSESEKRSSNKRIVPTIIIIICIGIVAVVMCSVFVGLCVARRRKLRQIRTENGISLATAGLVGMPASSASHSPISNSFVNMAGAARAAQMGGFCYISGQNQNRQYETLKSRVIQPNGTLNRLSTTQDDIYGWLYTPCGYNAYRNK